MPKEESIEWDRLCELLGSHSVRGVAGEDRKDGPLFSPTEYRAADERVGAGGRLNANVASVHALVVDYDTGEAPGTLIESWRADGLAFAAYSTHRNTAEHPKWRAVFPLVTPVSAEEWLEAWAILTAHVGADVAKADAQTKDPSRMYYLPSCTRGNQAAAWGIAEPSGKWLDAAAVIASARTITTPPKADRLDVPAEGVGQLADDDWVWQFVSAGAPIGDRRSSALRATRKLLEAGYPSADIHRLVWMGLHASPQRPGDVWTERKAAALVDSVLRSPTPPARDLEAARGLKPTPRRRETKRRKGPRVPKRIPASAPETDDFAMTDLGNAERMARMHGEDIRFVKQWGRWLLWDGRRWATDDIDAIQRRAATTIRAIYTAAANEEDPDTRLALSEWAAKSEDLRRLNAMTALARTLAGIAARPGEFDQGSMLLNCPNGTLDLRSGELRAHSRGDLLTRTCPVEYDAKAEAPRWVAFLEQIMGGDASLIEFLQRACGYALSGETSEQCFFMLHGSGSNGKSTFLDVLRVALGDYAQTAQFETLLASDANKASNDLARMVGVRLITCSEVQRGRRLNEQLIKQLTGSDPVTARFLFQEFFEFIPVAKFFLAVNHRPVIRGTDHAMWRRVRLIPFEVTIADDQKDKNLPAKLRHELPGILRWMVAGCLKWQADGLGAPAAMVEATQGYRSEMDLIGEFLEACCEIGDGQRVAKKALRQAYEAWHGEYGEGQQVGTNLFRQLLMDRGIREAKSDRVRYWAGVRLREAIAEAVAMAPEGGGGVLALEDDYDPTLDT